MNEVPQRRDLGSDYLLRVMGGEGHTLRALAVTTQGVARDITKRHGTLATAGAALSRVTTAALLMGGLLKGRQQVGIQLHGRGPTGTIVAIADARGNVRASIDNPFIDLPRTQSGAFDVPTAVGLGEIRVTKSLGEYDEPYKGVVPLVSGGIATDLAEYFTSSEQTPTAMGLGEVIGAEGLTAAGGFLIQALPGATDDELVLLEQRIGELPPLSSLLAEGHSPESLLTRLIPKMQVLEKRGVQRTCICTREKMESVMVALGEPELTQLIDEQEVTEVRCHWCNDVTIFTNTELSELLAKSR